MPIFIHFFYTSFLCFGTFSFVYFLYKLLLYIEFSFFVAFSYYWTSLIVVVVLFLSLPLFGWEFSYKTR